MRRSMLSVCLALLAPAAAFAQAQAGPGQSRPGQARVEQAAPGQAVSSQLIALHDDLRLSSDQEAAWRTYTQAIAPSPQMDARHRSAEELLPLVPTPRRVALIEANMADDLADLRRQGEAVTAFYNQLTPDQQRIFDRETLPSPQGAEGAQPSPAPAPGAPRTAPPRP